MRFRWLSPDSIEIMNQRRARNTSKYVLSKRRFINKIILAHVIMCFIASYFAYFNHDLIDSLGIIDAVVSFFPAAHGFTEHNMSYYRELKVLYFVCVFSSPVFLLVMIKKEGMLCLFRMDGIMTKELHKNRGGSLFFGRYIMPFFVVICSLIIFTAYVGDIDFPPRINPKTIISFTGMNGAIMMHSLFWVAMLYSFLFAITMITTYKSTKQHAESCRVCSDSVKQYPILEKYYRDK